MKHTRSQASVSSVPRATCRRNIVRSAMSVVHTAGTHNQDCLPCPYCGNTLHTTTVESCSIPPPDINNITGLKININI